VVGAMVGGSQPLKIPNISPDHNQQSPESGGMAGGSANITSVRRCSLRQHYVYVGGANNHYLGGSSVRTQSAIAVANSPYFPV
jgi:hypothetical protein